MKEEEILKCLIALILGFLVAKYFKMEGFSPEVVASTSLSDMNNRGCCVSNTAGYSYNPISLDNSVAPGFGIVSAYSNPCHPM